MYVRVGVGVLWVGVDGWMGVGWWVGGCVGWDVGWVVWCGVP